MGTFATYTTLDTLIPGIGINTTTAQSLGSRCIDWAEGFVKAKLARRYDVSAWSTFAATPPQVKYITEQIATGHFFQQISRGAPESLTRGQNLIDKGSDQLMMIAKNECDLVNTAGSFVTERTTSAREDVICSSSAYHTTFDEDNPLNWEVDSSKLSDIASGRD